MTPSEPTSDDAATDMDLRRDDEAVAKVHEMIADARFAMFGTYDASGTCHSRPMAAVSHGGEAGAEVLWFFTRAESRKVAEIGADPRVTVDYADPSNQNYVSVTGRAEVLDDRARIAELWSEPMRTWFPEGRDDPAIRLVRVAMDTAEYWDSPSSAAVFAFGYAKARLTGEPPSPGDVARVKL